MRSPSNVSFGAAFNGNGGGVYASASCASPVRALTHSYSSFAVKWDSSGISVYFFERSSVPLDIDAGAPQPATWGLPMAHWPAADCDPWKYFYTHVAIFDTTLCGGQHHSPSALTGQL